MIRFFLFLLCVSLFIPLSTAQIRISGQTLPILGDTLYLGLDNLPEGMTLGTTGGPQTWDFTTLQAPFSKPQVFRLAQVGRMARIFEDAMLVTDLPVGNGEAYYRRTKTSLNVVGTYGEDFLGIDLPLVLKYRPALPIRRAPLQYQRPNLDQTEASVTFAADDVGPSYLDELPISSDSFRVRLSLNRQELVDAYGTVQLPSGKFPVLRLRRVDNYNIRLDAKLPFVDWKDVTDLLPENEYLGERVDLSYHFLSEDQKTPIAIVEADAQTEAIQRVFFLQPKEKAANSSQFFTSPGLYAYPNPAILEVRFDFKNLNPDFYEIRMFNILGVEVWSESFWEPGNRTVKVDLNPFSKGTYLYSIVDSEGKTLSTKRLVIVRP